MSGKGSGSGDNRKKPSAIIDLKATEVRSKSQPASTGGAPKGGSPTGTASALKASTSTGKAAETASGAAPKAGAKPTASASSTTSAAGAAATNTKSSGGGSGAAGGAGGKTPPPAAQPAKGRGGGGILSTLSHMVAAVIGGAVVLYGGADLAKQAGLPVPERTAEVPAELTTRLASLEDKVSAPASASVELPDAVKTQLAALEGQSETISGLQSAIEELKGSQAEIAAKAEAASSNTEGVAGTVPEEVTKRIAQLEQTIETLSKAAGADGTGGGRIAQLAALSGKLTDLESTLQTQLSTLRQSVMSDIDTRLAPAAQASEAARSGTQRVDRELAETKTEVARLAQRTEAISATADRIDEALRAVREETGKLTSDVSGLKGDLETQIASRATPGDIETAVKPIGEKVTALESGLEGVLKSETSRKADAQRVVVALQLANLKRALDRGGSFANELAEVKSAAGDGIDVSALDPFKDEGVATISRLSAELKSLSHDIIAATQTNTDAGFFDQMLSGAKSIVRVRRTGEVVGADPNSAEAIVAKLEQQVAAGDLAAASETAGKLPETAKVVASGWMKRLQARASVDKAIAKIEGDLKSSLTGAAAEDNKS